MAMPGLGIVRVGSYEMAGGGSLIRPRFASTKATAGQSGGVRASSLPVPISRLKTLPTARTGWGSTNQDINTYLLNSQRRRGAFKKEHADRLKELRDIIAAQTNKAVELAQRQRQLSDSIESITRGLGKLADEEKTVGKQKLQELIREAQRLKQDKQEHEVKAESAELNAIWTLLPNTTSPEVRTGGMSDAILRDYGGDLSLLPDQIRASLSDDRKGKPLSENGGEEGASADATRDHVDIAAKAGWYDGLISNTVTGPSWPFLVGSLATLELALVNYAIAKGMDGGFLPIRVPDVVKRDILSRTGFAPREDEAGQTYWISADGERSETAELNDLALAATSEIALAGLLAGTTYRSEDLPIRLLASSHAFRAEAGARGKESRGLYRVHQFTKVELFVACRPDQSHDWLDRLVGLQRTIIDGLGVPYRVLDMPTEELGASAYRKYDIEAWMPGRGSWGEISSASNCTDFQARRLLIKSQATGMLEGSQDPVHFVHTLNGTAIAVPRMIVALLENYGVDANNRLRLPDPLKPFWPTSDVGNVEWIAAGLKPTAMARDSALKRTLNRVREVARRNGSDPASMVASFLILHELTAIVPLVLLFYLLGLLGVGDQVMRWLLDASVDENQGGVRAWLGAYIDEGMRRAERYGRRKGWFGFEQGSEADMVLTSPNAEALAGTFANAVAAYAIVKVLLPVRLAACFALAAPFARLCFEPLKRLAGRARGVKATK